MSKLDLVRVGVGVVLVAELHLVSVRIHLCNPGHKVLAFYLVITCLVHVSRCWICNTDDSPDVMALCDTCHRYRCLCLYRVSPRTMMLFGRCIVLLPSGCSISTYKDALIQCIVLLPSGSSTRKRFSVRTCVHPVLCTVCACIRCYAVCVRASGVSLVRAYIRCSLCASESLTYVAMLALL